MLENNLFNALFEKINCVSLINTAFNNEFFKIFKPFKVWCEKD